MPARSDEPLVADPQPQTPFPNQHQRAGELAPAYVMGGETTGG